VSTLSRYIFRLFAINVVTLLVILCAFVVTVDVLLNLDDFSDRASRLGGAAGEDLSTIRHALLTVAGIIDIWGPRLLQLFVYLNGLVIIAAAGFTATQLVHHREIVAILASGQSMQRVARPFLLLGVLMIGVQALVQEMWIPRVAHLLQRDLDGGTGTNAGAFSVDLAPDAQGRLWHAARFDDEMRTLERVTVWERDGAGRLVRTISAEEARWDGDAWALLGGVARDYEAIAGPRSPPAPGRPVERIETSLDPRQLKVRFLEGFARNLSTRELRSMLAGGGLEGPARERISRIRWGRVSTWAINLLTLAGAMAIFLQRVPRPMLAVCLRAAPVGLLGFAASAMASNVSLPGLAQWLSALLPALLVLGVAMALVSNIRT